MICVLCDTPINLANDTLEHIFPNAIGGRLKTRGFICESCNHQTGTTWDAELARQLNPLSLFLGITRERGVPPSQRFESVGGDPLIVHADGLRTPVRPTYREEVVAEGVRLRIVARDTREARKMLEGARRKYPNLDVEGLLLTTKAQQTYSSAPVTFSITFGGEISGRSVIKTALAFASHIGIGAQSCPLAAEYSRRGDAEPCFGYYYEKDLVVGRPIGEPIHLVSISATPATRQVLAYLEYFGIHRIVALLSDQYDGPELHRIYGINPVTGRKVTGISVPMAFSPTDIADIYAYRHYPDGALQKLCEPIFSTAMRRQFDRERDRVISAAVTDALRESGLKEGELITEEAAKKISGQITHKMMPFILHHIPKRRRSRTN